MNEDEDIAAYFLWFDELVKNIKGLGDEIKETFFCQKGI